MRRRALLALIGYNPIKPSIPNNEIWYTTSDEGVITFSPFYVLDFGANIVSNNYINGQGIISFDGPVTKIGDGVFDGQVTLISIVIPNSVTSIGDSAFNGCSSLTSINLPDSVTTIGYSAFYDCFDLTSVTIGDSVTTIGEEAFGSCYNLISINIPDSVTEIGSSAFDSCESLTSVTIGNGVTTIGEWAFAFCSSLTSVVIPNSVTLIGIQAFTSCFSLTSVYCKPTTPPALGSYVFSNNGSDRKIYVPMESVEAYKSASYWSDYASAIVGYDF